MGSFLYPVTLIGPQGEMTLDALVDTGASYTWVPRDVLEGLGMRPSFRRPFVLADGRAIDYDMIEALIRVNGETRTSPVIFGDPGTEPLLGVVTLEIFGLGVDPVNQELISIPGRLKGAR